LENVKYIIFVLVFLTGIPTGYYLVKKYEKMEYLVSFLMIFFTCKMVDINFFSREFYRGSARGFEVGMVDLVTIVIFLFIFYRHKRFKTKIDFLPPGSLLYFGYFFLSTVSLINSDLILHSLFELFKMGRMYFYFWVIYNYINDYKDFKRYIFYISITILYSFYEVANQKYRLGMFQTKGPFPHQNSLVMYMIIFSSIIYAYVLNYKHSKLFYYLSIFGMGAVSIVSSLSRAGLGLFALSISLITALTYTLGFSLKKAVVTFLLIMLGTALLAKAADSIIERFETAPESSKITRVNLAIAAVNMAKDKTFGVGINNFGLKINPPYSYGNHIKRGSYDDKGGLVETIYLMIAAETGWINLVMFIIMLLYFYFKNIVNYFTHKKSEYRFLTIGIFGALTAIYVESALEWVLKQTNNFYQLMFVFAIIAVMSKLHNVEKRSMKRQKRALASTQSQPEHTHG